MPEGLADWGPRSDRAVRRPRTREPDPWLPPRTTGVRQRCPSSSGVVKAFMQAKGAVNASGT